MPTNAAIGRARRLRKRLTPAEARLWKNLQGQELGVKFRRQHPVGEFIIDFYCPERRLGVEVDGGVHDDEEAASYDAWRTRKLAVQSIRVIRCTNEEVRDNLVGVLGWLRDEIAR